MRLFLAVFLLAAGALAEDPLLHDERVWTGTIEVVSTSHEPRDGKGREIQREKVEFRLGTVPPRQSIGWARLPLRLRSMKGTWRVDIDAHEGEGKKRLSRQGQGGGRLHAMLHGYVEPQRKRYKLRVVVSPKKLIALTTMAGDFKGKYTVWRTSLVRKPFLADFTVEGDTNDAVSVIEGSKKFVDKSVWLPRDVVVKWRFERVDPMIKGRVVDHNGQPLKGVEVLARLRRASGQRLLRKGKTDADGRFGILVSWGFWRVEVLGRNDNFTIVEGKVLEAGATVTREKAPYLEITLPAYDLRKLPRPDLYLRHFERDASRYFHYIRQRHSKRRIAAALLVPPTEG